MNKSPLEMDYSELNALLDSLLAAEQLPTMINYKGTSINYERRQRIRILLKAVVRLFKVQFFYSSYMKNKIQHLKTTGDTFIELKKTRCLKNLRTYLYLSKIGLTDLASSLGGRFNDKIFADFAIATMIYDASFDIPVCRKYLKAFDEDIMIQTAIQPTDTCLKVFVECSDNLREILGDQAFQIFVHYVQIEHASQLMSIYQQSDKKTTKEDLMKITFAKGGISGLALMHLMVPTMNAQQRKAVYELGAVMQIIDDISDIKEDLKAGIQTLPNQKLLTFEELRELYYGTINNLIEQCNLNPHQPNGTLDMLCWLADIILEKRYKRFMEF